MPEKASASGECLRKAGCPVRTQYSSSFQESWMPTPANSITEARAEPGTSLAQQLAERRQREARRRRSR